jgi:hypothetical protein
MTKKQLISKLEEMVKDCEEFDSLLKDARSTTGITDVMIKISEALTVDLKCVLNKVKEK